MLTTSLASLFLLAILMGWNSRLVCFLAVLGMDPRALNWVAELYHCIHLVSLLF